MRKILVLMVVVAVVFSGMTAYAAKGGQKGASAKAYENASEQSVFNRVGDWFATRGKSGDEKETILKERQAERAAERAQKQAREQKRQMEREAKRNQEQMKQQMKGMGKNK